MKISLEWLSDYIEIDRGAEEIAEILSNVGFPTEEIEHVGNDWVINVEVTSNRGDCLSHIGIARELAAATGKKLRVPEITDAESEEDASDYVSVVIEEPELCGRYTARVVVDVKVGPTPEWMRKRLEAVGVRSVNNIVDATNYAIMETGQPPHAFDYDRISGGKIIVRKGVLGEQLVSIDETKCDLKEDMLVIADEKGPVAIAGVMGGLDTEINESTNRVLLEDAQFNPVSVRRTGRILGISSEAAFRFERQVDTERVDWASMRTCDLIVQVAGGRIIKGVVDAYPGKPETATVGMRFSRLNKLLGIEVGRDEVLRIFKGLDFEPEVKKEDLVVAKVPTWRHDIYREADLIEEVARCHGFSKIPTEDKINIEVVGVDKRDKATGQIREFLNSCGFYETINVTFVDEVYAIFGEAGIDDGVSVKDESRKSASLLRQSLIGSLAQVVSSNYRAGNRPCRVYEIADTFKPTEDRQAGALPIQRPKIGLMCDGDFREVRGIVEGLVGLFNKNAEVEFRALDLKWAKAGAEIAVAGEVLGAGGILSDEVLERFDIADAVICAVELDFAGLLDMSGGSLTIKPIPRFPAVTRDLSLIVDERVCWADIDGVISASEIAELEDVEFVATYRGKPIDVGKKSVTVSLRFRDEDGTLRHETVDGFESKIVDSLSKKVGAELRTV